MNNIDTKALDRRILNLCKSLERYWKNVNSSKSRLIRKYSDWLDKIEYIKLKRSGSDEHCILEEHSQPEPSRGCPSKELSQVDAKEVLSIILEANLTKYKYILIKEFINNKTSSNILPSYESIVRAKKYCYPDDVSLSESKSGVKLEFIE